MAPRNRQTLSLPTVPQASPRSGSISSPLRATNPAKEVSSVFAPGLLDVLTASLGQCVCVWKHAVAVAGFSLPSDHNLGGELSAVRWDGSRWVSTRPTPYSMASIASALKPPHLDPERCGGLVVQWQNQINAVWKRCRLGQQPAPVDRGSKAGLLATQLVVAPRFVNLAGLFAQTWAAVSVARVTFSTRRLESGEARMHALPLAKDHDEHTHHTKRRRRRRRRRKKHTHTRPT